MVVAEPAEALGDVVSGQHRAPDGLDVERKGELSVLGDLAILLLLPQLGIHAENLYCTRIARKNCTYARRTGARPKITHHAGATRRKRSTQAGRTSLVTGIRVAHDVINDFELRRSCSSSRWSHGTHVDLRSHGVARVRAAAAVVDGLLPVHHFRTLAGVLRTSGLRGHGLLRPKNETDSQPHQESHGFADYNIEYCNMR